jgi:COX assembly protein 2
MHPPLDRPHPECQQQIEALQTCHATTSKLKFWACNEVKFALDQCLKIEKQNLLKELNKDVEQKRKIEEDAYQKALGKDISFEEYLKNDKDFIRAMNERNNK